MAGMIFARFREWERGVTIGDHKKCQAKDVVQTAKTLPITDV